MEENQPILDYAGPRGQSTFRMPAASALRIDSSQDGLRVTEKLTASDSTLTAMVFALVVLAIIAFTAGTDIWQCIQNRSLTRLPIVSLICAAAEGIVLLLVIKDTYRTTTLQAATGSLSLHLRTPFSSRRHRWDASEIQMMAVRPMNGAADAGYTNAFELVIVPIGRPLAYLFRGHGEVALSHIKERLWDAILPSTLRAIPIDELASARSGQGQSANLLLEYCDDPSRTIRIRNDGDVVLFEIPEVSWSLRMAFFLRSKAFWEMMILYLIISNAPRWYRSLTAGTFFSVTSSEEVAYAIAAAVVWACLMALFLTAAWAGCVSIRIDRNHIEMSFGGSVKKLLPKSQIKRVLLTPIGVSIQAPRPRWYKAGVYFAAFGLPFEEMNWLAEQLSTRLGVPLKRSFWCKSE